MESRRPLDLQKPLKAVPLRLHSPVVSQVARTIMETLGHSMVGTTLNLYTHVMSVVRRDAADRMDKALGSTNGGTDDEDPPSGALVPAV